MKKHFWVFNLAIIALGAGFLARATEHLLEAAYLPPTDKPGAVAMHKPPAPVAAPHGKDDTKILERNVFCSACPPIIAKPTDDNANVNTGPQKTTMPVRLIVTAVSDDKRWSIAVMCDTTTKECGAFGLDSKVREATVIDIAEKRVEFDVHGHVEYVEFDGGPVVASNAPPPPTMGDDDPLARDLDKGVKKISETEYQVNRDLLDKVLGDTNLLARSARIVPNVVDGKPAGFKLYAIRPNSVYARIGLQNGDAIQAINGYDMSSPDKALEVYTKLRRANHLTVSIQRRGQNSTLDYAIR